VRQDEIRVAFEHGWEVLEITGDTFDINPGMGASTAQAWLVTLRRD
jgi:hypothetical protein